MPCTSYYIAVGVLVYGPLRGRSILSTILCTLMIPREIYRIDCTSVDTAYTAELAQSAYRFH